MKYTPVGIDIAKHLMQVHFIDEHTGEVIDKQIKRDALLEYFSNREPCLIGMEACGGSQYWARELEKLGHKVRLLQGKFVKAFVMGNKNDVMDARAIWMAVHQPAKAVAVKTEEQQAVLSLHKIRRQLVKFRNALHGLFLEFGETVRKGRAFAAYIGLVPKQTGTGGKVRLLGISKRGDAYMRTLFIHGARAATLLAKSQTRG